LDRAYKGRWGDILPPCGGDAAHLDRRTALKLAAGLGLGVALRSSDVLAAEDDKSVRPRKGDRLVFAYGERAGQVIAPEDLPLGGPQQLAFPMDPVTKVIRDGSLLNQVALIRLDPAQLSPDTRAEAAAGIVAYSAVCTHEGCPISMWHKESKTLFCACHASRFDPADRARVVDGPAPRRLAMLPLGPIGGGIVAAGGFTGRVGRHTA
jgi:rieske iron-sulfur protein